MIIDSDDWSIFSGKDTDILPEYIYIYIYICTAHPSGSMSKA